jgi:chromosome segregation ATPase
MLESKVAAALQAQEQNFAEQIRVYEDWNKTLRDAVAREKERRKTAEADVERLAGALRTAAVEVTAQNSNSAGESPEVAELESRCKQLQLELSREQDARRRAETEAKRTAEQNQQLVVKLQVLDETVAALEADAVSLKQTAANISQASAVHS